MSRLRITLSRMIVLLSLLVMVPSSHAAATVPTDWQKGAVVLNFGPNPYRPSTGQALTDWQATGGTWVALAPVWYMTTAHSNTLAPDPNRGSPSDASLQEAVQAAKARGLRVMLKPYFDVKDGTWRAEIAPNDTTAWWTSYRAFMAYYLDIAQTLGVDEVALGTEMISMTKTRWDSQWRALIIDARGRYHGALTYSANWGKGGAEYKQITWWGQLDYIGLSAYFPISLKPNPSVDDLVRGWTKFTDAYGDTYNWVADIGAVQARFNKPVIFPEIGFGSYANTAGRWDVAEASGVNLEAQSRAYEATLRVWSAVPWFKGLFWWYWDTDPAGGGLADRGQASNNKPATGVITAWFGGTAAQPAPPVVPTASLAHPTATPTPPAPELAASSIYFAQTGYTLRGGFLEYWRTHGGLDLFGYPITAEYAEVNPSDGRTYTVQYVERERFEYHPANPPGQQVLLGLLGVQVTAGRQDPAFAPVPAPASGSGSGLYFPETGHTLGGGFLAYWQARGAVSLFGYPISEEFAERNASDGQVYTVQYFQRARMEYHPEHAGTTQGVQLGLLGSLVRGR